MLVDKILLLLSVR